MNIYILLVACFGLLFPVVQTSAQLLFSKDAMNREAPLLESYPVYYRTVKVGDLDIFYREAGSADAPVLLLLHGFPSSSFMYRNLINELKDNYHILAPDYPGFGFSSFPDNRSFEYTFENISKEIESFVDQLGLTRFSMYIQDYGSPVGFRLATRRPELLECLIVQNGNAYEIGLGEPWNAIKAFWRNPENPVNQQTIRDFFQLPVTRFQYEAGVSDNARISPESYHLDQFLLNRPGNKEVQYKLMYDYRSNVQAYPQWQQMLRKRQPPTLIVWGENDPFFTKEGALSYAKDVKNITYHFYPTGHFALEEYYEDIASKIDQFLLKNAGKK